MWGDQALERFIIEAQALGLEPLRYPCDTTPIGAEVIKPKPLVLDIGSGKGEQALQMGAAGLSVDCCDLAAGCDYTTRRTVPGEYDGVWCCHVLEHILDVQFFLEKVFRELKTGGVFAVTVPPAKPEVVGGHVSLWTPGLLIYRLVLAGFDCSEARVGVYGYNISVLVNKKIIADRESMELAMDCGDVDRLARFFPIPFQEGQHGFEGFSSVRWDL